MVAALELCHYTDILKNTLNAEMKHETETLSYSVIHLSLKHSSQYLKLLLKF